MRTWGPLTGLNHYLARNGLPKPKTFTDTGKPIWALKQPAPNGGMLGIMAAVESLGIIDFVRHAKADATTY